MTAITPSICVLCWLMLFASQTNFVSSISVVRAGPHHTRGLLIRGGASKASSGNVKRKSKKKRKGKKSALKTQDGKEKVSEALKEKDAAEALGDAIRERADILRADTRSEVSPLIQGIDQSIQSVGWAMGSSDGATPLDDDAGIEVSTGSVVANYFLKSHGGAHALQSACSLLAVLSGIGALVMPVTNSAQPVLMKRCLQLAILKHISGLLAATVVAAKAIPEIGLSQARTWMEQLAVDPVSQYVFYSSALLVWTACGSTWWKALPQITLVLLGPILLREWISTAFVVSDVLVLLSTTSENEDGSPTTMLRVGSNLVNAGMSLLVTPGVWRSADAAAKQRVLAKLVARISLVLELGVGLLLAIDGMLGLWQKTIQPKSVKLLPAVGRLLCARLFIHFLFIRRKKIQRVAASIRGGAIDLPGRLLDVLLRPGESMGVVNAEVRRTQTKKTPTWLDYVRMAVDSE
uniref:Uncharacterized protein n=1 Tax=Grammatophora oceanica TaxID=210454 RepID=A0A7S1V1F7_9STRA|mmetsp:Transcript_30917/g.45824  ORF Transcript_30917/g.45824 Transcript_30917/m.45824 type:complete len:463 (+) Transcript_30917:89-1477(+)